MIVSVLQQFPKVYWNLSRPNVHDCGIYTWKSKANRESERGINCCPVKWFINMITSHCMCIMPGLMCTLVKSFPLSCHAALSTCRRHMQQRQVRAVEDVKTVTWTTSPARMMFWDLDIPLSGCCHTHLISWIAVLPEMIPSTSLQGLEVPRTGLIIGTVTCGFKQCRRDSGQPTTIVDTEMNAVLYTMFRQDSAMQCTPGLVIIIQLTSSLLTGMTSTLPPGRLLTSK